MRNMMCAKKKKNKCSAIKLKKKKKLVNSGAICLIVLFASTLTTISLASNIGIVTAAAVAAQYVDTNSNVNNHKLNYSNNKDNNNVDFVGNNLSVINNNKSNNSGYNSKINHNQSSAVVALVPPGPVFKPSSNNVLIPKLEPNEFILPSKTVDPPRRKDFGQLRMYQPIQPFPSIFLSRASYEDLPQVPSGINTATTFDVTELSKAIEKRLKNIRNLELGVSVVQVSFLANLMT